MKFYFLQNEKRQSAWAGEYDRLIKREFDNKKVDWEDIELNDLSNLTADDYVFILHYLDLDKEEVKNCKAKRLTQINGTSANPFIYQVDYKTEQKQILESVDYLLALNARLSEGYNRVFFSELQEAHVGILAVGFPSEVPEAYQSETFREEGDKRKVMCVHRPERKKQIVVGGRISPDKQFYLAVYLLRSALEMLEWNDYKIIFAYNSEKDDEWADYYGKDKFERENVEFRPNTSREEFLDLLNESQYYFTCSLGDTGSITAQEAIMCGTYPLIPHIHRLIPTYSNFVDINYEAFSVRELAKLMDERPILNAKLDCFDPSKFVDNLLSYLS